MASLVVLAALASCTPPPALDLTGTEGPHGVAVSRDHRIILDDGRVLRADLYEPTDPDTGERLPGPFPVIIGFTPYGKSDSHIGGVPGANGVNLSLVRHGYIAAAVDIPGTGASDGAFDLFDPAEAVAGAAVVQWAANLDRSSGTVGMLGLSYAAIVQLFTAAEVGPDSPLKAIFPMSATVDPYRDLFVSGGALNLISPLGLLFGYGITRSITPFTELWFDPIAAVRRAGANLGQMAEFEAVMAEHMFTNGPRRYDGDWWQTRRPENTLQRIVDNDIAVYLVGGQYDVFQRGVPLLYSGLQNAAAGRPVHAPMEPDQPVSDRFRMLSGPWTHGNLGEGLDMTAIQLAWFDRWLKDTPSSTPPEPHAPEPHASGPEPIQIVEPGGNTYGAATYPLADAGVGRLWLRSEGELSSDAPDAVEEPDTINYFPLGPTCTVSTVQFAAGLGAKDCLRPQRRVESSWNETTYTTEPLGEDLQLAGPIGLSLWVTSSRSETLLTVTLEDVAADGTSMDITGGAQLGSLRQLDPERSWPSPDGGYLLPYRPLTKASASRVPTGEPVRHDIEVRPAFTTVPKGHRLRLRVSTADFPHIVPLADAANLAGGRYRLHHEPGASSFIDLSVRG